MPELSRRFRVGLVGVATFLVIGAASWAAWEYWSSRLDPRPVVVPSERVAEASTPAPAPVRWLPVAPPQGAGGAAARPGSATMEHVPTKDAALPDGSGAPSSPPKTPAADTSTPERSATAGASGSRDMADSADAAQKASVPRTIPNDLNARERIAEDMRGSRANAVLVYDLPDQLTAYEERFVKITLKRGDAGADTLLTPDGIDLRKAGVIPTSDYVNVSLKGGRAFQIVAVRPENKAQDMHASNVGEWEYFVTGQEGGSQELILDVTVDNNSSYTPLAHVAKTVTITVPLLSRIWQMLDGWPKDFILPFAAGVLSILAASWYERRTRKPEAAASATADEVEPIASVDEAVAPERPQA